MIDRPQTPKGLMDRADLRRLLLAFPELKQARGAVRETLAAFGAPGILSAWDQVVEEPIAAEDEDREFGGQ